MRTLVQVIISIVLTLSIGFIIIRQVPDWGKAFQVMIQGHPLMILAGLAFVTLHMILRAARWGVLLTPAKKSISYKNLLSLTLVKYVVNVIPPRSGEVAASAVLAKKECISATTVIAASMLERILDMVTVLIIFGFYLFFFGDQYVPDTEHGREIMLSVRSYSLKGFLALCAVFIILGLLLRGKKWSERIPEKIRKYVLHFLEGFRALQSRGTMLRAVILSGGIWFAITVQLWFFVRAYLGDFPFAGSLLLMAMTVVGVSIPTPGGVGGFQFFMDLTLVNFFSGYLSSTDPYSQAAGISNGAYLVSMVPLIVVGLVMLNKEGLSLSRISKMNGEAAGAITVSAEQEPPH